MNSFERLTEDALALLWEGDPVAASFAGETDYDARLPETGAHANANRRRRLDALSERLEDVAVPATPGTRLDARFMRTLVAQSRAELDERPRLHDPAWYTGEACFGLISLLLRPDASRDDDALRARLAALPDFFADGIAHLAGRPLPPAWVERARGEAAALGRLLRTGLAQHRNAPLCDARAIEHAAGSVERFTAALAERTWAEPACGTAYLAALMKRVHGLNETPAELEARAAAAFAASLAALEESAARLDRARTWREQLADLADIAPPSGTTLAAFATWHARALAEAGELLSPVSDYALEFAPLPAWAAEIAHELYFLWYRSPPARHPGRGSTYWVDGEPNTAAIKLVHAVHHGSIGHHTQNAYARAAASRFARVAGTDGASALALLSAGTMVEGWACYAEDLIAEIPGFYTSLERLQLEYFTARNIACCLADVRLHTGVWSLEEMRQFYRDDVAFAPARIVAETTRNSMFPGSRLMYWIGTTQIAALRARSDLSARAFHDRLLSFGSAPIAWITEEFDA